MNPDSENADVLEDFEKEEFLVQLFRRLVVGGSMCQFEDSVDLYLDCTRQLYKEVMSVRKNPTTKEISTVSFVYRVASVEGGTALFPHISEQNDCFLIIDPILRSVVCFYFGWLPFW